MRILILGGTAEALDLARRVGTDAAIRAIYSLAGATPAPRLPALDTRIGGFGGAIGLAEWLRAQRVSAVIDATHPFAARISANAARACADTDTACLRLERPAWRETPGDRWMPVPDLAAGVAALGDRPRRVFLTTGRKDLAPFGKAPWHHYLIRSIAPPEPDSLPPHHTLLIDRPPHDAPAEAALMRAHRIDIVVTKNAGSEATVAKLDAARALGLPVVMIARPVPAADAPPVAVVATVAEALARIASLKAGRPHAGT